MKSIIIYQNILRKTIKCTKSNDDKLNRCNNQYINYDQNFTIDLSQK